MANFDEILDKAGEYATSAVLSGLHSATLGFLGLAPENVSESIKTWQEENPKAALGVDIAGFLIPQTLATKAVKATAYGAKVANAIKTSEKLAKSPVAAKALEFVALDAPIEIGRQAVGFGLQKTLDLEGTDLGERALESSMNLAASGALGALGGAVMSAGKRVLSNAKLKMLKPEDPWQWQLRDLNKIIAEEQDPVVRRELKHSALKLDKAIRGEDRDVLVGPLENGNSKGYTINTAMKGHGGFSSKMLQVSGDKNDLSRFTSGTELTRVLDAAQEAFGEDWISYVQFPRWMQANKKALRNYTKNLNETGTFGGLEYINDGWHIGKEKDGMYVISKTLQPKDGKAGFLTFKTDMPEKFLPQRFEQKAIVDRNMFADPRSIYKEIKSIPGSVLNRTLKMQDLLKDFPVGAQNPEGKSIWKLGDEGIGYLAEKLTGDKNILKDSELWNRTKGFAQRYLYPTVFKFKDSPAARKIFAVARDTLDTARLRAAEFVFGAPRIDMEGSTIKWLTKGIARNDPNAFATRAKAYAKANPEGEKLFTDIINRRILTENLSDSERKILGEEGLSLLEQMDTIDNAVFNEMSASIDHLHLGNKAKYIMRQGHRGISHFFEGGLRQAVLNEQGNLVYIASGNSRKVVQDEAKEIIAKAQELGRDFHLGEYWTKDHTLDIKNLRLLNPEDAQVGDLLREKFYEGKLRDATFRHESADIKGFKAVNSMNDVVEALHTSLENKFVWLGNEIIDNVLAKDIQALGISEPQTALMLQDTMRALQGQSGEFSTMVNKVVDSVLSPVLGTNSASRIAGALNSGMARLDLGFWNMSYFLANLLQPIQTLTPQIAMLQRCPEALQWAYDTVPILGAKRGGLVSVFSPMKWLAKGMRLMANPKAEEGLSEFLEQMVREGTLTSRALESYVGESSEYGLNLIKAFKEGSFVNGLKNICNWTANYSEQVSRAYALTVGYSFGKSLNEARIAKGLAGWSQDQLYSFARKFCDNTMFQFATADRARILQGPVGTTWGLFKNWGMHWIGWQMQYLDAGLKHGSWAPFMLSNTMTSLLGGIGASEMGSVAEKFYEWASDEKLAQGLYDRWEDGPLSNFALYGIPGAFGFSIRNQVTSSFVDPGEEASRMLSVASFSRLKALWNALGSGMDYYLSTGDIGFAKDRNFQQQLLRAIAPKNLYRQLQVVDGQIRTMGTKNLMLNAGPAESFFYKWFNIPSVDIDQAFQISSKIWKDKQARMDAISAASNVLADALYEGDSRVIGQVLAMVGAQGLDLDSVVNAASTKLENRDTPLLLREPDALNWLGVLEP